MFEIRHYVSERGEDLVSEWLRGLRDLSGKTAIVRRLNRLASGNFGDFKSVRDGVLELRIDVGPGYRIYYARAAGTVILLLCGGSKRTQGADIDRACALWREWQSRKD